MGISIKESKLQDRIAALEAERDRLRTALEFYTELDNWQDTFQDMGWGDHWRITAKAESDMGDIARRALEASHD